MPIRDTDFADCPVLLYVTAQARLVTTTPVEFRTSVLHQVPLDAARFPLGATEKDLCERRIARTQFVRLVEFAVDVGVRSAAAVASDFALWLGLRDIDTSPKALEELRESMSEPSHALRRVNLALRYGLEVDVTLIEQQIERETVLTGEATADHAYARLAIAMAKKTPKETAEYIDRYRREIYDKLYQPSVLLFEVSALVHAGLTTTARERIDEAVDSGIGPDLQAQLEGILAEQNEGDPVGDRRARYDADGTLGSLLSLVQALEERKLWQDLLPFAEKLFTLTRDIEDLARVAYCLEELGRYKALSNTLEAHPVLVGQSKHLKFLSVLTLYRVGRFQDAQQALAPLFDHTDPNMRALQLNIAIASGNWTDLLAISRAAWTGRAQYTSEELIRTARLSLSVAGPHTRDLVLAAVEQSPSDAEILASAYFVAVRAGWERDPEITSWLTRAAALSGANGPIKQASMEELARRQPLWDDQIKRVWAEFKRGRIPAFVAGQIMHRSLSDICLASALRNSKETDARRRQPIFAYSGARLGTSVTEISTLAVEPAALLTFSMLGVLQTVLARYNIVIPHGTLRWLFEERDRVSFHQPSRIADARNLRQLIANKGLKIALLPDPESSKLLREVGPNLARMLTAARMRSTKGSPTLVVRSHPIPLLGSLMSQEADVAEYGPYLCSCAAVVKKMLLAGTLTQSEAKEAGDYLRLHERLVPNEPHIEDGVELYLDDLSLTYLQSAGVLEKLKAAGISASIGPWADDEAGALIDLASVQDQELHHINEIQRELATGMPAGTVSVARAVKAQGDEVEWDIRSHPTFASIEVIDRANCIVIDDRYINRLSTITGESAIRPVFTSLEILAELQSAGDLSGEEVFAYRTALRRAGYQLIPVSSHELLFHLRNAPIVQGKLTETAELKAIRESLITSRIHEIVQLPDEIPFMNTVLDAAGTVIEEVWKSAPNSEEAAARSDYLVQTFDPRIWASTAPTENQRRFPMFASGFEVIRLSLRAENLESKRKSEYLEWFTKQIVEPAQNYDPDAYRFAVTHFKEQIVTSVKELFRAQHLDFSDKELKSRAIAEYLKLSAPVIRESILMDPIFRQEFESRLDATIAFPGIGASFGRSKLYATIRAAGARAGGVARRILDESGGEWDVRVTSGDKTAEVTLSSGKTTIRAPQLLLLTASARKRLAFHRREAKRLNWPGSVTLYWHKKLKNRPLTDDEQWEWTIEALRSPIVVATEIRKSLSAANVAIETLVPRSIEYYERLIGKFSGQKDIKQYADEVLRAHVKQLRSWRKTEGLQQALLLGMHSSVADVIASAGISLTELEVLAEWGLSADVIAREAILELALKVKPTSGKTTRIIKLTKHLIGLNKPERYDQYELLSIAYELVDGEFAKLRQFRDFPLYWRRLAAFSQAALIVRCVLESNGDQSGFIEWMREVRSNEFQAQGYADLRLEPRWRTSFAAPAQLKQELGGRLFVVAKDNEATARRLKLHRLLLGKERSLSSQLNLGLIFLTGPLEGGASPVTELGAEMLQKLRKNLEQPVPHFKAFEMISNAELFYKLPDDIPHVVADAIRRVQYHFEGAENSQKLRSCALGLAALAATSRSSELADEVITMMRHYRRFFPSDLSAGVVLHVGLIACASRFDETEWCRCVGTVVTELSLADLADQEAAIIYMRVIALCELVPQLWATCGAGIAALDAIAA